MPWQETIKPDSKLFVFAHRGEAQAFLRNGEWKNLSGPFDGLFYNHMTSTLALITGEGRQSATQKMAAVLGCYSQSISEVLNFGVAGNLRDKKVSKIYCIRTVYASEAEQMIVKSFTTSMGRLNPEETVDCISADRRVLNEDVAEKLSHFGDLVDREIWSIASVCQLFSIPFNAFKIVSDSPKSDTPICELVKEQAAIYSEKLLNFYNNLEVIPNETDLKNVPWPLKDSRLYFTISMTRQLEGIWESLLLKGIEPVQLDEMEEHLNREGFLPKQKATQLIKLLSEQLDPIGASIQHNIQNLTERYRKEGIYIRFPHAIEDESFGLSVKVKSKSHLHEILGKLESFPYKKLKSILDGDLHV